MTDKILDLKETFDDPVMMGLAKLDVFIFTVIIVSTIAYYQIQDLFNTEHQLTVDIALVMGFIFAGIMFLSIRQWRKPSVGNRQ